VAPVENALGGQLSQRPRGERQALGGAWAVCGPFATAARLLGGSSGGRPRAVWCWGQAAGYQARAPLQAALATVAQGYEPTPGSRPIIPVKAVWREALLR
jgi:hypothetical protein